MGPSETLFAFFAAYGVFCVCCLFIPQQYFSKRRSYTTPHISSYIRNPPKTNAYTFISETFFYPCPWGGGRGARHLCNFRETGQAINQLRAPVIDIAKPATPRWRLILIEQGTAHVHKVRQEQEREKREKEREGRSKENGWPEGRRNDASDVARGVVGRPFPLLMDGS